MPTELTPLDPRARLLFYLQAFTRLFLVWLPLSIGVGGLFMGFVSVLWGLVAGATLFFAQFVLAVWWPNLQYERWGYALGPDELLIARGVLVRRITAIPLARVQHVDTRQGLIEQSMGLMDVIVSTASGIGGDGVIPGLSVERAEAVRDELVKRRFEEDDGV